MKKRNKMIRAFLYVILGVLVAQAMLVFVTYMWISGTFLAGQWLLRKLLYLLAFAVFAAACWCIREGFTYLERHLK